MSNLVITVSQLNQYARSLLEQDQHLASVFVCGEISNFTNHYRSGHWYLSLKDENAVIQAVVFRSSAQHIKFLPQDGMRVICHGRVTLYDRDGRYQLYIDDMQPDGLGALSLAYEQRKEKLEKLGLFAEEHKQPLPPYPETIAVVTSPTGAALQDILNILTRRYPLARVLLCPVQVQGEAAPAQLTDMMDKLSVRNDVDVIIIGRGGGSLEDLWAFNSEELAFAIYNCPIPVISAVGHETDFTIADFVADLRAPTPSAAAELAVPDAQDLAVGLAGVRARMRAALQRMVQTGQQRLGAVLASPKFTAPATMLDPYYQRVDTAWHRAQLAVQNALLLHRSRFDGLSGRLTAYSPLGALRRGYAIARKNQTILQRADQVAVGDRIDLQLSQAVLTCTVDSVKSEEEQNHAQ